MNNEVLIKAVYDKPPLWDRNDKLHNNRDVVECCWKKIGQIMKENPAQLRKKWKYLRDQFGVELGKILTAEEEGYHYKPKWRFYHAMLFLKDVVKPRPPQITCFTQKPDGRKSKKKKESSSDDTFSDSMDSYADDNFEPLPLQVLIESSPPASQADVSQVDANDTQVENISAKQTDVQAIKIEVASTQTDNPAPQLETRNRKRRMSSNSFNEAMLDIEKKKLELLEGKTSQNEEKDDDHVHFFKSILSHVRKIPQDKVLVFRNRVQDLVAHFAYQVPLPQEGNQHKSMVIRNPKQEAGDFDNKL